MFLETLGIGLVIPILNLLSESSINLQNYAIFNKLDLGQLTKIELVIGSMLVLLSVYSFKTIFLTYVSYRQVKYLTKIKSTLSDKLFDSYLKQPYDFHLQINSSELIRNINDIDLALGVLRSYMMLVTEVIVLFGVGILLFIYEPLGTILSMAILGSVGFYFNKKIQSKVNIWGKERQRHEGFRMMHLLQGFGAIKDIKVLGREKTFIDDFSEHNVLAASSQFKQNFVLGLPRLWFEWLTILGIILLVLIMISQGKDLAFFIPTLGLFAAAAFRLMPSITRVMNCNQQINFGLPVIETVYKELSNSKKNSFATTKENDPLIIQNQIELKKICYSYPKTKKKLLANIDLKINCGQSIGLIGESGIGKTTLINIILGLLTPDTGSILVDGKNILKGMRNWQNQIGYVPQNIYLNDDTIKKNIAFGIPEKKINNKAVDEAIHRAQLTKFVSSLTSGVDTKLGECGERISGGQRQRIGIARAIYNDPKLLIFDESTNSLDLDTEKAIINDVDLLKGNKTIIMIAHRMSTLSICEKIYRLTEDDLEFVN